MATPDPSEVAAAGRLRRAYGAELADMSDEEIARACRDMAPGLSPAEQADTMRRVSSSLEQPLAE